MVFSCCVTSGSLRDSLPVWMLVLGTESEVIYIYTVTPTMVALTLTVKFPLATNSPATCLSPSKLPSSDPPQQEPRSLDHMSLKVCLASPRASVHPLKTD